ncbi:MAG: hypothetical protein R3C45_02975 [Phycisphaerales bacterium]
MTQSRLKGPPNNRRAWVLTASAILITVTAARLWLNFRHTLTPGMDGAYYPLQTWWLIEHGKLMFHDLPLFFWLNSLLAHLIRFITGSTLNDAVIFSSRLIDGVAQPWSALPIMMLGYAWSSGRREALPGCAAAAVLAVMSPPIMRMASDFQKNSLGLVWMVFALWAMRNAMAHRPSVRRWGLLCLFILLSGLTHIGAFGVTCVMLGATAIAYRLAGDSLRPTRTDMIVLGGMAGLAAALIGAMLWLEPVRTVYLLGTPWRVIHAGQLRLSPPTVAASVVIYSLLVLVVRQAWRDRDVMRCDRAVVTGAAVAVAMLTFPFLQGDYALRFMLMSPVPGAVLVAFVMARRAEAGKARWPAHALVAVTVPLALISPMMMLGPVLSTSAFNELNRMRDQVPDPAGTLIVAPHGVEFWAGLVMHTPVSWSRIPDDAFTQYARVLILEPKPGPAMDRRPPPPGPDGHGPPGNAGSELKVPADAKLIPGGESFNLYELPRP